MLEVNAQFSPHSRPRPRALSSSLPTRTWGGLARKKGALSTEMVTPLASFARQTCIREPCARERKARASAPSQPSAARRRRSRRRCSRSSQLHRRTSTWTRMTGSCSSREGTRSCWICRANHAGHCEGHAARVFDCRAGIFSLIASSTSPRLAITKPAKGHDFSVTVVVVSAIFARVQVR